MAMDSDDFDDGSSAETSLTSSVRESDTDGEIGAQSFPYGFPMPFYLCEHYGGLPLVLNEEDASPVEGQVWLQGDSYPVGVKVADPETLSRKTSDEKPAHLEWVETLTHEIVPGIALLDSTQVHPMLYYLLADNDFYPMACTKDNVPVEGYVLHPEDQSVMIPVGLQHYDEAGCEVKQKVFCLDGEVKYGIPAHPEAGWSTHYLQKPGIAPPAYPKQRIIPPRAPPLGVEEEEAHGAATSPRSPDASPTVGVKTAVEKDMMRPPVPIAVPSCAQKKMSDSERKVTETRVDIGRSVNEQLTNARAAPLGEMNDHAAAPSSSDDSVEMDPEVKDFNNSGIASSSLGGDTRVPESYLDYDSTRHLTAASGDISSTASCLPHYSNPPYVARNVEPVAVPPQRHQRYPSVSHLPTLRRHGVVRHTKVLETKVPVVHEQVLEKVVEVKQPTQINTTTVEVPFCEDKILYRPHKQIIEVPVEVVKEIRKPITRPVEKVVHVPGHVVEVPKPYPVAKHVPKHVIQSKNQLWRIQESSKPLVVQEGQKEIECIRYEPEITIVDVYIPKKVEGSIANGRQYKTLKTIKDLSTPHWNTLVYKCNESLANGAEGAPGVNCLPFIRNHPSGTISVLATNSLIGCPLGAPYLAEPETELLPPREGVAPIAMSAPSQPLTSSVASISPPRVLKSPASFVSTVTAQPVCGKELMPHWWREQQQHQTVATTNVAPSSLGPELEGRRLIANAPPVIVNRSAMQDEPEHRVEKKQLDSGSIKTADDFFVEGPQASVDGRSGKGDFGCRRHSDAKCTSCWCV